MKTFTLLLPLLITYNLQSQNISSDIQLKNAVLAAPEDLRQEAKVYGYDSSGNFIVLRQGTNDIVCIADDPESPGVNVACYHKNLEPFMARGRELRKQGKNSQEIFDQREEEVRSGQLKMPEDPAALFVFSAKDEDKDETGAVNNGNLRYVIYIPYATAESTGLPLAPSAPGMPWIMDPGTHRAHIMITP
jgi:hypothetical protein